MLVNRPSIKKNLANLFLGSVTNNSLLSGMIGLMGLRFPPVSLGLGERVVLNIVESDLGEETLTSSHRVG